MSAQVENPVEQLEQTVPTPALTQSELKARKAIKDLGLKPVDGINRVTFRTDQVLSISHPQVFRSVNSDTFIVFGELKRDDMNAMAQAAQQLAAEAETNQEEAPVAEESAPVVEEEEDDEEVDAEGVDEKDIELVVSQANVSRNKAVKALKNNNNDVVNSIMELTM